MYMKSLSVTDYSTGNSYSYGDNSGSWQSIRSNGGQVNGNAGGAGAPGAEVSSPSPVATDPAPTNSDPAAGTTSDPAPIPWSGTHKDATTTTPTGWPWTPTTMATAVSASTSALPGAWTVSGTGRVQPPGTATVREPSLDVSPYAFGAGFADSFF